MAVVEVVEAKITADTSQFDRQMNRVKGSFGDVGAAATRGMAVAGAAVGAGAAVAAGKGITAFAGFETSINEVFTLMPGITDKAMADMSDDIKDFSKEMGVATNESVPALYQAISAGVPANNVFDFLETAQMAAVGGVTDLETAVDGISSVVNAYGEDVVNASEASDLMFTAVKLGKTDFEQLSRSIFQVAPIAASMGVGFGDVSAALATLTAQGVPTSVAATQMKAAVSELGKEGTTASEAFEKFTGKTFKQFIDGGGNLVDAFVAMQDGADEMGESVLDSFGSIEAGQAVLALTADGGEAFSSALGEMNTAAGATETAFTTMEGSVSRDFDKLKASLEVLAIDLGEKLAPAVSVVIGFVQELADAFGEGGLGGVATLLREKLAPVEEWMKRNKPIIGAVAVVIGGVLVSTVYSLIAAFVALLSPFVLITAAVAALVAGFIWAYENVELFRTIVDTVVGLVVGYFQFLYDQVSSNLDGVIGFVTDLIGFIVDLGEDAAEVGETVAGVAVSIFDKWKEYTGKLTEILETLFDPLLSAARTVFNLIAGAWNSTVGGFGFKVPDWIPGVGGKEFKIPNIPRLAEGGIVTAPTIAMIGEGGESEAVIPLSRLNDFGGGSTVNVTVNMPPGADGADVVRALQAYARTHGGSVPIITGQL
jgi:TP901 family phage tail tape measure protein